MTTVVTRSTYLEINSIPLATPAWDCLNIHVLWQSPAIRGSDRLLPGAVGVRPRRRRVDVTKYTLELVIRGEQNWEGTYYASAATGLETNVYYLRSNVTDVYTSGDGTRSATLHNPAGGTKTGYLHVESFQLEPVSFKTARATIDISIPAGALA